MKHLIRRVKEFLRATDDLVDVPIKEPVERPLALPSEAEALALLEQNDQLTAELGEKIKRLHAQLGGIGALAAQELDETAAAGGQHDRMSQKLQKQSAALDELNSQAGALLDLLAKQDESKE